MFFFPKDKLLKCVSGKKVALFPRTVKINDSFLLDMYILKLPLKATDASLLAVNGICGGWGVGVVPPPLLQDFLVKNISILYAYDFLTLSLKFYQLTFSRIIKALAALGSCHVTSSRQGVNENL